MIRPYVMVHPEGVLHCEWTGETYRLTLIDIDDNSTEWPNTPVPGMEWAAVAIVVKEDNGEVLSGYEEDMFDRDDTRDFDEVPF